MINKKYIIYGSIIIILLVLYYYYLFDLTLSKMGIYLVPNMKRPFLNMYTDTGKKINIVFITHPFTREECIKEYNKAKNKGVKFLGMSSYCEFPGLISNPHDILHDKNNDAWKYDYFKLYFIKRLGRYRK